MVRPESKVKVPSVLGSRLEKVSYGLGNPQLVAPRRPYTFIFVWSVARLTPSDRAV